MSDNRENIKQKKRILEQGFLNGFDVYRALEAGINNILPYQDKLDEINVFPVPDGDTGTNMCFTLLPIVEKCGEKVTENAEQVYNLMADTALESARGNSGTIIAQFFHGMRKSAQGKEHIYIKDFAASLKGGYDSSIDSLLNPKEGTIITVMRDVANAIDQTVDTSLNGIYNLHYKNYKIIDIAEKIKEKIGDVEIDITPMSFEDARNYQVSSEKLEGESKFKAEIGLEQGIDEIYELILNNRIKDINDPRYSNQNFLKEHGVS